MTDTIWTFPPPGCCVFPSGDPGCDGFHFCGAAVDLPGFPYCAKHARRAYASAEKREKLVQSWEGDDARRAAARKHGLAHAQRRRAS